MSLSREQMDVLATDNIEREKQRIADIRKFQRPYSEEREKLWCEVFLRSLDSPESYSDPFLRADRAVIEFDKRFEHRA